MNIGSLDRQIQIQARGVTPDPLGGNIVAWTLLATVWANVRYLNGMETLAADAIAATAKASFRIRRREDVDATCRILFGNKTFNILAVLPDEQGREYVDLACETGANDG